MNEQIREIHRQVMLWSDTPDCLDTVEWDPSQIPEEYTKKFAELIVRKCIQVIDQIDADDAFEAVGLYRAESAIKQHFGVEE